MQQHPYDGPQPPYGGPQHQPPYGGQYGGPQQPYGSPPPPEKKPNVVMAAISLGCGVFAMFLPVPVLDVILGIVGIVLASIAMKSGVKGLAIAGLVVSIVGTVFAIGYTIYVLGVIPDEWVLMSQPLIR